MTAARVLLLVAVATAAWIAIALVGCRPTPVPSVMPARCAPTIRSRVPQLYPTRPTLTTPLGVLVDATGASVPAAELAADIDRRASAVAACLDLAPEWSCTVIRVAPIADTPRSCYSDDLLLPIGGDQRGCHDKGQRVTAECPCRWRVAIMPDGAILVPQDLRVLGAGLVRVWTGAEDPWLDARLARCSMAGCGARP